MVLPMAWHACKFRYHSNEIVLYISGISSLCCLYIATLMQRLQDPWWFVWQTCPQRGVSYKQKSLVTGQEAYPKRRSSGSRDFPKLHLKHRVFVSADGCSSTYQNEKKSRQILHNNRFPRITTTTLFDVRKWAKLPPNCLHCNVRFQEPTKYRSKPQKPSACA